MGAGFYFRYIEFNLKMAVFIGPGFGGRGSAEVNINIAFVAEAGAGNGQQFTGTGLSQVQGNLRDHLELDFLRITFPIGGGISPSG